MVMEMQPIEIPEFPRLHGKKAIKGLHDFVEELEERRGQELTDKQIDALTRIARELISTIEYEKDIRAVGELEGRIRVKTTFFPSYTELAHTRFKA